jgi:hypothetical protein
MSPGRNFSWRAIAIDRSMYQTNEDRSVQHLFNHLPGALIALKLAELEGKALR